MWKRLIDWLDIRIGLNDLIKSQLTEYRVPANINIFYTLGFVAFAAFLLQTVTGAFLIIYYTPHPDHAFKSVQEIMNVVPYGWFVRLVHVVGSNLMVVTVLIHMLSVMFMGSYKKPREVTWFTGALMLLMTLAFCLSGYLLPWSQLSYWATTVVTVIPTAFPYAGEFITRMLRGGDIVSGPTLKLFFAFHVAFIPALFMVLLGLHFFLIRRIGTSSPPFGKRTEEYLPWTSYRHESHAGGHPFFPHFVVREMYMTCLYIFVLFFIIAFVPMLFLPEAAMTPADPFRTPSRIKPEWYFLAPYQMLKLIPNKFLGISLQAAIIAIFLLWPVFDKKREANIMKRPLLFTLFVFMIIVWVILTVWGHYS